MYIYHGKKGKTVPVTGRFQPPGRLLVLISGGRVDPRAIMQLEGSGRLKKKSTSLGLETATFRLVAQYFNQLRYRVPHIYHDFAKNVNTRHRRWGVWGSNANPMHLHVVALIKPDDKTKLLTTKSYLDSKQLSGCCMLLGITGFLDFVHLPVF
jgi:hypothetical protein